MERFSQFEKNLLQGLYRYDLEWGNPGAERFTYPQLRWLQGHRSRREVRRWPIGRMHITSSQHATKFDQKAVGERAANKEIEQSICVLEERDLIADSTLNRTVYQLRLTGSGIAMARRLDTWYGRVGIYYEERREGILGLLVTVAIAAITSIITTHFTS